MALAGVRMRQLNHATCVMAIHADRREARGLKTAWPMAAPASRQETGRRESPRSQAEGEGHEHCSHQPRYRPGPVAGMGRIVNGDLSRAEQILVSGFTVNAAIVGVDGAAIQGARRG